MPEDAGYLTTWEKMKKKLDWLTNRETRQNTTLPPAKKKKKWGPTGALKKHKKALEEIGE